MGALLAWLALLLFLIYSLLPYKTPWNGLAFYYGWLLLAGIGTAAAWQWASSRRYGRTLVILWTLLSAAALLRQSLLLNDRFAADPGNPWVYAHPGADVARISQAVLAAAAASPEGAQTRIEVAVTGHGYWPLPWTLRRLPNIGWYDAVDTLSAPAPLILISPEQQPVLVRKLYEMPPPGQRSLYMPLWQEYTELRPGVEIRGYVRKDLADLFRESLTGEGE